MLRLSGNRTFIEDSSRFDGSDFSGVVLRLFILTFPMEVDIIWKSKSKPIFFNNFVPYSPIQLDDHQDLKHAVIHEWYEWHCELRVESSYDWDDNIAIVVGLVFLPTNQIFIWLSSYRYDFVSQLVLWSIHALNFTCLDQSCSMRYMLHIFVTMQEWQ
jgi:hypothetical protein